MPKVSRPIVYTALFAVVGYAVFLYTQPDAPVKHTKKKITVTASAAPDGFLPEDLTAHFARYTGKGRDAFTALVTGARQQAADAAANKLPGKQAWALTGITTVNDSTTAIVENQGSGESAFLKAGDSWNGLKVVSIGSDTVTFRNALGQETHLAFAATAPEPTATASAAGAAPYALPLPAAQTGGTLAPMPIQPLPGLQGQGPQGQDPTGMQPGMAGQDGSMQPADTQGQYGGGGNGFGGGGRRRRRQFGSY
jgi:hypothetical protein